MMLKHLLAPVALALSACGGSTTPARSTPHIATVEVPDSKQEPAPDGDGAAVGERQPERPDGDFAACIRGLRAASAVGGDGQDRALYDAALDAERAGDMTTARKSYFALIQGHPASKLVPLAYLAFGEMFAAEVPNDPTKRDLAKASYREVLKYPPPESSAYAYTWLRLGEIETEGAEQLSSHGKASDAVRAHPGSPCATLIAEQARLGMVRAYVDAGAPDRAWGFFRAKLGDKDGKQAMRELVSVYLQKGRRSEACGAAKTVSGAADLASEACSP